MKKKTKKKEIVEMSLNLNPFQYIFSHVTQKPTKSKNIEEIC